MPAAHANLQTTGSYQAGSDPVFASRTGGPLECANVYQRVFKPAARRAPSDRRSTRSGTR